ncbi:MAG: hypothetical protein JO039_11020 [Solirubrobacterales bacterium]|nr:hypothetical protein [Solirubrobacterales bacterium]MBV9798565.1 hypothetical protein [Solirubrobacterales bacterium]
MRLTLLIGCLGGSGLALAGAATAATYSSAHGQPPARATVLVDGNGTFVANRFVRETLHFVHADVTIRSGGKLTFEDGPKLSLPDPHTLTIVNRSELPRAVGQLDVCFADAPGTPCLLGAPNLPSPAHPTGVRFVDVGKPGLDERGDSLGLPPAATDNGIPHGKVTVTVTAKPGTTLYFFCAVHPWMQGVIHVK